MNIILGPQAELLRDRYIVLQLDTIEISDKDYMPAYAVIDSVPLDEMGDLNNYRDLHQKLMENYYKRNWKFCQDAIEHLLGRWRGQIDSFYHELKQRVEHLQNNHPADDWTGFVVKARSDSAVIDAGQKSIQGTE